MNAHLSSQIVERFHSKALTQDDRGHIYDHILGCEPCRKLVVIPEAEAAAVAALTDHLLPQADEGPFHLDATTIEEFVDDRLDPLDRSVARLHLEDCAECSDEVADFRESLATMRATGRTHESQRAEVGDLNRSFRLTPSMRIAATIALVAFAAVALLAVWRWKSSGPKAPGMDTTAGFQPPPQPSPAIPSFTPSPATVNPPKLATNNPPAGAGRETPSSAAVALKDGPNEISVDQTGNVTGLSALPADSRQAVKNALRGESLNRPEVLDEVAVADISTRSGNEERIGIISPTETVIAQDKPTLRWNGSKTADRYRVEIADSNFRQVAKSDDLPQSRQTWSPSTPLKRGEVYTWTIRGVNKEGESSSGASQGKFKIIGENTLRELNELKMRQSHLALGLFYAREGMTADAEREFQILAKENPNSVVAKTLLKEVRGWRKR
jgi:hypothetical protein